ncbi:hypothetical protein ABEV55_19210 [Aneurinibacillus thermoaerophilus]|uniref:hypothetical protein n=1 Tax=Aneurinibacillus thermoaerophilus TaxID=143495 RepID=UPI002E1CEB99|nr:hypothetical protein [Aneurinibacillus thermoaerophilus]
MSFMEMYAAYSASRSQAIRSKSMSTIDVTLEKHFTAEELEELARQKELSSYISQCSYSMEILGIREGEEIDGKFLENLSTREKNIFRLRFEERKGFTEIPKFINEQLRPYEVELIYKRILRKIKKEMVNHI